MNTLQEFLKFYDVTALFLHIKFFALLIYDSAINLSFPMPADYVVFQFVFSYSIRFYTAPL